MLVAFDPGVVNVGVVAATVADGKPVLDLARRYNLSADIGCLHRRVKRCRCLLHHTEDFACRTLHLFQELRLESAEKIIVERQPPQSAGYTFEQLLLANFPEKLYRVSPRRVHAVYKGQYAFDYEERKQMCVAFCDTYLGSFKEYTLEVRRHDIADAYCALTAYFQDTRPVVVQDPPPIPSSVNRDNFGAFLDQFRMTEKSDCE
jgi:hypothetical protein